MMGMEWSEAETGFDIILVPHFVNLFNIALVTISGTTSNLLHNRNAQDKPAGNSLSLWEASDESSTIPKNMLEKQLEY